MLQHNHWSSKQKDLFRKATINRDYMYHVIKLKMLEKSVFQV